MQESPLTSIKLLLFFILISALSGGVINFFSGNKIDFWVHDSALVFQQRTLWKYTGIVVLDDEVPIQVGRKQALPLFAKAAERLIAAGAKGVFLDARLSKEIESSMPYAVCIKPDGNVEWSSPRCALTSSSQCHLVDTQTGTAPLRMNQQTIAHFSIAPYLPGQQNLPDFLLYDLEAVSFIPESGLVASDRLVTRNDPIARWLDLSKGHAVLRLANFISPKQVNASVKLSDYDEICDKGILCRRIRLSTPIFKTQSEGKRLIIPVSQLASCNRDIAEQAALRLKDKAVIMQLTSPSESTDIIVTPMTTALFGPKLMTPGAQYLADSVETFLNLDHPRPPGIVIKAVLFLFTAIFSVLAGAYLKQPWLWFSAVIVFVILVSLCFFNPIVQLWPVTVTLFTFLIGAGLTTGTHLIIGFREGTLIRNYMPRQIHNMLISLESNESFHNRRCQAVVLMSDLAGYTTVTGLLKEPLDVLNLMNDYLSETSLVLQDQYLGWLEGYVGDMVCYYWPHGENEQTPAFKNALLGSLELARLQKNFFATVGERYKYQIDDDALNSIRSIINAGIGLTTGKVVMGDLGPKKGVRKFGILGDPLNLAARIESLTRLFNTEIIITEEFRETADTLGIPVRRLGRISVKGRKEPATLYATGFRDDIRFETGNMTAWENWLSEMEHNLSELPECPEIYHQDKETICKWKGRGLLGEDNVWHLDEK